MSSRTSGGTRGRPTRLALDLSRQNHRKARAFPVVLGSEACAEGHDWPQARHAILMSYSWSPDKIQQFLNRIWRINSPEDIDVWLITCDGTIDERMADLDEEKRDAAELVLDGEFWTRRPRS